MKSKQKVEGVHLYKEMHGKTRSQAPMSQLLAALSGPWAVLLCVLNETCVPVSFLNIV